MARNIEVLRNYFLGKDPQLKETMADNSLRLCGIQGKYYILRSELIARLEQMKKYVDDNDQILQNNIDAEALARSQRDGILQGNINAEANTRQYMDTQLSNRITSLTNNVYTKSQVDYLINEIPKFAIEIVSSLPTHDISTTTIYLVANTGEPHNYYDEYIYINNNWEMLGTTQIDLSDYYTKSEVDSKVTFKKLTSNLTLPEHSATITGLTETGWYNTANYVVNAENALENPWIPQDTLFYYDATGNTFCLIADAIPIHNAGGDSLFYAMLWFDDVENKWEANSYSVSDTISSYSSHYQVPTAKAVYDQLLLKQNTLTAGTNINITSNTISTDGYTVKTLTDFDTNVWALDSGVYYIATDGYLHIDPDNSSTKVQLTKNGLLIVEKASNTLWKYTLYMGDYLIYGLADTVGGTTTSTSVSLTNFVGTSGSNGRAGLVPAPTTSDANKYLKSDGTWSTVSTGQTYTAGTNISISAQNAISTVGDTIKSIITNTNVWGLNTGVYKVTDGNLYLNPSDASEYISTNGKIYTLLTEKLGTNAVRFYLIGQDLIVYGVSSMFILFPTSINYIGLGAFTGTDGVNAGASGFVPAPTTSDTDKYLKSDGTWATVSGGGGSTITYGTTDLTPNVSPLNDGEFYFVYS